MSSARMAAAASSTDGTECSSCSVVLERGIRWGLGGWGGWRCPCPCGCGEGERGEMGSMSRSKMAELEEWLWVG